MRATESTMLRVATGRGHHVAGDEKLRGAAREGSENARVCVCTEQGQGRPPRPVVEATRIAQDSARQ